MNWSNRMDVGGLSWTTSPTARRYCRGLRGEVGFRTIRNLSSGALMQAIWPETVSGKGKGHLDNEGEI